MNNVVLLQESNAATSKM